ncbi:MAG: proline dehydrogenase [Tessaracoccus sp.]|uniref:hypothetical protein n=1 Tax=Tessaracoccus sp. TaxID=1971211 RepID=UPI001EC704F6|nr:hypothetical protein [Tessaracoccus sp.]MBK7822618.1 proline dehydrogenase [Tessaracoccus sp.]
MGRLHATLRQLIGSPRVRSAALASGVAEEFASGYVAGIDIDAVVPVVEKLSGQGLDLSLTYLPAPDDEAAAVDELAASLARLGDAASGVELSIKPSQLSLAADPAGARARLVGLCEAADDAGAVVTLEMQGVGCFDKTLGLWRAVRSSHPDLGVTLPADVFESERVVGPLADSGARVRLCIGAYPAPKTLGHRREQEKAKALVRCLRATMERGGYAMVASHDPTIISIAQELARRNELGPEGYEHQMFYGVRPLEQRRLVDIGHRCRTYVPFGPAWYEYLTTQIAARPRAAYNYLRALGDKR